MWCPVVFMKKQMCMCCKICIEINYVHVACNVLIHVSFMTVSEENTKSFSDMN